MDNRSRRARRLGATLVAAGLLAAGGAAVAQQNAGGLDKVSGARLPYLTRHDLGAEGRRLADTFARNGKPSDPVTGPLAFAAYDVPVANALLDLHNAAVGKGSLAPHARELAIMVACRETNYSLEWNGHMKSALDAGVDPKVIDAVLRGKSLEGVSDADAAVIRFGRELLGDRKMSAPTFSKAVELFGRRGAMDLVAVMSTYAVSGFFAIAVDEHPPGQTTLEALPRAAASAAVSARNPLEGTTRFSGAVRSLAGRRLSVAVQNGGTATFELPDSLRITRSRSGTMSDLAAGKFVGCTAVEGDDGSLRATECHIFPESMRGAGEGHNPMGPPKTTMTNGNIATETRGSVKGAAAGAAGLVLHVAYEGGAQDIAVSARTQITQVVVGDTSLLKPGVRVNGAAREAPDGRAVVQFLNVVP